MAQAAAAASRRRFSLARSEQLLGWAMLAPAFLMLGLIVVYPVVTLLTTSLYRVDQGTPIATAPFVGLLNYADVLNDSRFWTSSLNTLIYVLVSVPGALVVGLGLALLANQPMRIKWPARLGLLLPWALPVVFAGLIFRWFFDSQQGIVNDVLARLGFMPLQWLSSTGLAMVAICAALVWKTSSFVALVLLAGLQTIPREFYEAAEVDGASKWQQFTRITLPMLRPAIVVALIFRTITAIQTFDIPYAMTGGGPGDSTETLAMYIHKTTIDFLDFGYGSALATVMFVVSAIATSVYLRHTQRDRA